MQAMDNPQNQGVEFLRSLSPVGRGWSANTAPGAVRRWRPAEARFRAVDSAVRRQISFWSLWLITMTLAGRIISAW
jgi:hypothetical protein